MDQHIYDKFKDEDPRKQNAKYAVGAVINAIGYNAGLAGTADLSLGANSWDGLDFISSKHGMGKKRSKENFDDYKRLMQLW